VDLGKKIIKTEKEFNTAAGFTKAHDRLPRFFQRVPLGPHNVTFQVSDEDLDAVFGEEVFASK
jgi:aldehyde:ferredoxin oxidoreductase